MARCSFSRPPSSPSPSVDLPDLRMTQSSLSFASDDDILTSDDQLPLSSDCFTSSPPAPSSGAPTLPPSRPEPEGVTEEDWATFPWLDHFPEHVRSDGDKNAWWWKHGFKLRDCRAATKPKARSKFICVLCHRKALGGRSYNVSKFTFDASGAGNIRSHLDGRHKLGVKTALCFY